MELFYILIFVVVTQQYIFVETQWIKHQKRLNSTAFKLHLNINKWKEEKIILELTWAIFREANEIGIVVTIWSYFVVEKNYKNIYKLNMYISTVYTCVNDYMSTDQSMS